MSSTSLSSTSPIPTLNSNCNYSTGSGGYLGLYNFSCNYSFCPSPCTSLLSDRGYAIMGEAANFNPLCDFTCSHSYCPNGVYTNVPYSTTPSTGTVCVQGVSSSGYTGLYCPSNPCTYTLYSAQIAPPPETSTLGLLAPELDASYMGLCSYACNHEYYPLTAYVLS
ncbi:hypothetical protein QBC46DRAFT_414677 [Diplogelasinospora grovesii]|uniref:Uncharacterized protein n=1 Tax=Diplogelasinospora grovesii TaxID=303347 RepID=A0AAN6MU96_9PEZI|nr:hypothetical protein QBC46DRAFT_414677 [Diplogelasinospora grovesii]